VGNSHLRKIVYTFLQLFGVDDKKLAPRHKHATLPGIYIPILNSTISFVFMKITLDPLPQAVLNSSYDAIVVNHGAWNMVFYDQPWHASVTNFSRDFAVIRSNFPKTPVIVMEMHRTYNTTLKGKIRRTTLQGKFVKLRCATLKRQATFRAMVECAAADTLGQAGARAYVIDLYRLSESREFLWSYESDGAHLKKSGVLLQVVVGYLLHTLCFVRNVTYCHFGHRPRRSQCIQAREHVYDSMCNCRAMMNKTNVTVKELDCGPRDRLLEHQYLLTSTYAHNQIENEIRMLRK